MMVASQQNEGGERNLVPVKQESSKERVGIWEKGRRKCSGSI